MTIDCDGRIQPCGFSGSGRQDGRTSRALWAREIAATLALSWPLVLTNLAQTAMAVTDLAFIGRLGPQALAASALATNLYMTLMFFAMGLVTATAPTIARELGANPDSVTEVRRTVRQGLWSAIVVSIPAGLALWNGQAFFIAIGQAPELAAIAGDYLRAMLWALPPFLGFLALRSFVTALERPHWAFVAAIAAILFNALANWLLVFGNLGFPALGIVGSGAASAIASAVLFFVLAIVVVTDRQFRRYQLFARFWKPDWPRFIALWKLGLPIAVATTLEVTIFSAAAFLMGWIGEAELAAHAIALQITVITFMAPQGISQAATVRVGRANGAGDAAGVTRAGWSAFGLGIAFMAFTATLMLTVPHLLIWAFLDIHDPANAHVLSLAASFLAVGAAFQIMDGAQVLGAGMLRGLHDTRVPMYCAALGYWGIGLTTGAALAFWGGWRGVGIWMGLAVGLAAVATLLTLRWMYRERLGLVKQSRHMRRGRARSDHDEACRLDHV